MIKVICVAYERPIELMILIGCFLVQMNPNWELYIIYDGQVPETIAKIMNIYNDKRIHFAHTETRNEGWGHPNRKIALDSLEGNKEDYVLITNDDNYYVPTFVDQMLKNAGENIGIVYCDCVHSYDYHNVTRSQLKEKGIDMGAFIVAYNIAKWNSFQYTHISADGAYAEQCRTTCANENFSIVYVPRPLFIHN